MRASYLALLGLCALELFGAGCSGKARRTICIESSGDCQCHTMDTTTTRTVACSTAAHPGWSCCQSGSSSECSCRAASCPPTLASVDDCAVSSAAAATPLSSVTADGGSDASSVRP